MYSPSILVEILQNIKVLKGQILSCTQEVAADKMNYDFFLLRVATSNTTAATSTRALTMY